MQYTPESRQEFKKEIHRIHEEVNQELVDVEEIYSDIEKEAKAGGTRKEIPPEHQKELIAKIKKTIPGRIKEGREKILIPIPKVKLPDYIKSVHRFNPQNSTDGGVTLLYDFKAKEISIAYCCPGDCYCRNLGIHIAREKGPLNLNFFSLLIDEQKLLGHKVLRLLRHIELSTLFAILSLQANEVNIPHWLKRRIYSRK